ncbi:DUF3644 domain-containing protein [Corynebacterium sp. ACRQJ]|uniref:DUF3644 domain-containing protein n=1 Tax=Corynebacterium sp. ACRQJ TaxID=2918189 RepID=UPI001EF70089|nr:DUF3644 domain-containing protein [Corynebacterium sp. ACRQJ]MCG7267361.1 DUF3644 domain-containing protein [Corynebacterium sp. ACRQJ]
MARPYVSHKKLCDNSRAAMLAAIEIYNKPQTTYREQVVTVLVVNAWELILKAALRKAKKNIFYKKKRGEDYRSFSLEHCIADMDRHRLWPSSVDGDGVRANLHVLTDYRNKIIHLYVSDDLNTILYMFLQQSIVNYRDFVLDVFGKDLADDITWTLLPLAASTPSDAIRSLRVDGDGRSTQVVEDFLRDLRKIIGEAEDLGADMGRIAMLQEINLQSGKKISRADLEVAIDQGAATTIVQRKVDPNETHPYSATQLIARANRARKNGRELSIYDLTCMAWKHNMRDNCKFAWQGTHTPTHVWSGDALSFLKSQTDEEFDRVRAEYQKYQRGKKHSKK